MNVVQPYAGHIKNALDHSVKCFQDKRYTENKKKMNAVCAAFADTTQFYGYWQVFYDNFCHYF